MEILALSDKPPWPPDSGGSFASRAIINQLIRSGHKVTVICYQTPKHPYREGPSVPQDSKNLRIIPVRVRSSIRIIDIISSLLFTKLPYDIFRYRTRQFRRVLEDIIIKGRYKIIQFEGLKVCRHIDIVSKNSNARLVYRAHNVESKLWEKRGVISESIARRWYFKNLGKRTAAFERHIYKKIDGLIAISEEDRAHISNIYTGKCATIFPCIEKINLRAKVNKRYTNKNDILFLGSLDWQPNIHGLNWFLREVYPFIKAENTSIKLRVAGRGASNNTVRMITKSGAIYCGSPEDSESFLQTSTVLIVPLFASSGIRVKIIEALGLGLDIVSTAEGAAGLPGEIKNIIDIEERPENFARQILKLINNKYYKPDEEHNRLELIKGFFGKFTCDKKIDAFYSDIINDS